MIDGLHDLSDAALSGAAGRVVSKILPHTEASAAALLFDLYASYGNAVGRGPFMVADGAIHRANLDVLVVGRTSRSRKGTSRAVIAHAMQHVDEDWAADSIRSGLSSGEGLIDVAAGRRDGELDFGGPSRLFIYEAEFSRSLGVMSRKDNTLSAVLRLAWDGSPLSILTRKSDVQVDEHYISVLGHMTVAEFERWSGSIEVFNGLLNRFLPVLARRSQKLPSGNSLTAEALRETASDLRSAIDDAKSIREMHRTPAAEDLWYEFYMSLDDDVDGPFGALTARAEAQVLRLSMVEALMNASSSIDAEHLMAAIGAWEYVEESARQLTSLPADASLRAKLHGRVKAAGRAGLTRTEIHDVFNRHQSKGTINRLVGELVSDGLVEELKRPTGGRSVTVVRISTPTQDSEREERKGPSSAPYMPPRSRIRFPRLFARNRPAP